MKKQRSLLRHSLACLFALWAFTLYGQGTCGTSIALSADTSISHTTTDSVRWYRFTATETSALIILHNSTDVSMGRMENLYLYSGNCSNLTRLYSTDYTQRTDTSMIITAQNLYVDSVYYIEAHRAPSSCSCAGDTAQFRLAIISDIANHGCPATNVCPMIPNGNFSDTHHWNDPVQPFFNNQVCNWLASHGSPQLFTSVTNSGPNAAFMWSAGNTTCSANTEGEGIYVNLSSAVIAGRDYYFTYFVRSGIPSNTSTVPQYSVRLTNNLQNSNQVCLPAAGGLWLDGQTNFNNTSWQKREVCFSSSGIYTQLWIYPQSNSTSPQAWIGVDDIQMYWINDAGTNTLYCTPTPYVIGPQCAIPGATYSWSPTTGLNNPNIANPTATPTVTTTYTMTVTLPNNMCTRTATVTIFVAPPATISPNDTICAGESAQLTATGGGTYSWSPSTGLSATNVASPVATPAATTTYTVTINSFNCISTKTVTVVVYPTPSATITGPTSACGGAGQGYSVPSTANTSYSWSVNPSAGLTQSSNTATVDFSANVGQSYWVIVTATDTITGCSKKDSLYVGECCSFSPPDTNKPTFYNTSSSQLAGITPAGWITVSGTNYTITGKSFTINGTFTVQGKTTFNGCDIKLGYNARIIISAGDTLIITDNSGTASNLWACNEMWDGIYVDNTSSNGSLLTINNGSTIQDGLNAIYSDNGGQFEIYGGGTPGNVKLNKNFKNVVVKNKLTGTHPGYIKATDISCRDNVVPGKTYASTPAHTLRFPKTGKRTYVGVEITDVAVFDKMGDSAQAGNKNTFDYMDYGVRSWNSSVTIKNNEFMNITAGSALVKGSTDCPTGTAICSRGNSSLFSNQRTLIVGGPGTNAPNTIRDGRVAVDVAENMNVNIRYNTVSNLAMMGITAKRINLRTVTVNNNSIDDAPVGINAFNLRSSTVKIRSNNINLPNKNNAQGIVTAEIFASPLTRYNISLNTIDSVRNGITATTLVGSVIDSNQVWLRHTSGPSLYGRGIFVTNSSKPYVRKNSVYGKNNNDWWIEGIRIDLCHTDTVLCNTTSQIGAGEFFSASQPFTYFARNIMDDNLWGLLLNGGGYISPQGITTDPNDNIWSGTFAASQTHTYNSFGGQSPFIVQNVTLGTTTYNPANNTTNTFSWEIPFSATATASTSSDCGALTIVSNDSLALAIALDIVNGLLEYPAYEEGNLWLQEWALYHYLKEVPALKDEDPSISDFYNAADTGNIGRLYRVARALADVTNLSDQLSIAQQENNAIVPANSFEANWKVVNDMLITNEVNAVAVPTDEQITGLDSIAQKCPLSDGPAVYIARAMLAVYDTSYTGYENSCEQPDTSSGSRLMAPQQQVKPSYFKLYPNPSNGELTLACELAEGESGELVIFDLSGRAVKRLSFTHEQQFIAFKAELNSGIYLYRITVNGEIRKTDKLVIVK